MDLTERIKRMAAKQGITVQGLEKASGLSNGSISKWKNSSPKSEALARVADCLGCSTDYLLGRNNKKPATVNIGDGLSEKKVQLINQIRDADDDTVDLLFQIADRIMHDRPEE